HANELVADDAFSIDEEGFWRAVYTQIKSETPLRIADIQLVGIVELLQPFLRGGVLILVVDAVDHHALRSQLVKHRVLDAARYAPGRPYINQGRLANQVVRGEHLIRVFDTRQTERRKGLADQCRGQYQRTRWLHAQGGGLLVLALL